MTQRQKKQFNKMLYNLKLIGNDYQTPKQLRKSAEKTGMEFEEYIEMAYENIQTVAKLGVKGVKKITFK